MQQVQAQQILQHGGRIVRVGRVGEAEPIARRQPRQRGFGGTSVQAPAFPAAEALQIGPNDGAGPTVALHEVDAGRPAADRLKAQQARPRVEVQDGARQRGLHVGPVEDGAPQAGRGGARAAARAAHAAAAVVAAGQADGGRRRHGSGFERDIDLAADPHVTVRDDEARRVVAGHGGRIPDDPAGRARSRQIARLDLPDGDEQFLVWAHQIDRARLEELGDDGPDVGVPGVGGDVVDGDPAQPELLDQVQLEGQAEAVLDPGR